MKLFISSAIFLALSTASMASIPSVTLSEKITPQEFLSQDRYEFSSILKKVAETDPELHGKIKARFEAMKSVNVQEKLGASGTTSAGLKDGELNIGLAGMNERAVEDQRGYLILYLVMNDVLGDAALAKTKTNEIYRMADAAAVVAE